MAKRHKRNQLQRHPRPDPTRDHTGAAAGMVVASIPVLRYEGRSFGVADRIGLMPLLKFAHLAKKGVDADDMEGLVAIYDLLKSVIADEEWEAFEEYATERRATGDDLMEIVTEAIQLIADRPTERPSVSPDGPPTTSPSSPDDSSSRVIRRLEKEGRPSIALMVRQAQEHASRASA